MPKLFDTAFLDQLGQQHLGLVTHQQLRDCALTDAQIHRFVLAGLIIRVRRSVYRVVGAPILPEHDLLAACLAGGPGVFASFGSAGQHAGLWGAYPEPEGGIEVTAVGTHRVQMEGVRCHRVFEVPDWQRQVIRSIPCTSPARTICDLSSRVTPFVLEAMVDKAIRARLCSAAEIHRCLDFLGQTRRRGLSPLRKVMKSRDEHYDPGDSGGEARLLRICRSMGIERPAQRVHLDIGGKDVFPDGTWFGELVVAEYDGSVHERKQVRRRDREKIALYASAGLVPVVFTDEDSDRYIGERLQSVLGERRRLAAAGLLAPSTARVLSPHAIPGDRFAPHHPRSR